MDIFGSVMDIFELVMGIFGLVMGIFGLVMDDSKARCLDLYKKLAHYLPLKYTTRALSTAIKYHQSPLCRQKYASQTTHCCNRCVASIVTLPRPTRQPRNITRVTADHPRTHRCAHGAVQSVYYVQIRTRHPTQNMLTICGIPNTR